MQDLLKETPLFAQFTDEEIELVFSSFAYSTKKFDKGSRIFSAGQKITSIALVLSGSVHVQQLDWWGNLNIIKEIKIGEIFGEAFATMKDEPLPNDVVASSDCEILFLDMHNLFSNSNINIKLIQNLYCISSAKNRFLTKKVRYLSCRTTRDKLMAYLSEQAKAKKSNIFDIPFNRQELADYISVERSAMSAELSKLKKEGLIDFQKNHFILLQQ